MSREVINGETIETHDIGIQVWLDGELWHHSETLDENHQPVGDTVDWWKPAEQIAKLLRALATDMENRTQ